MRVLILGYGYIGSALASRLAKAGHEVVAVRRGYGALPSAATSKPMVNVVQGDITEPASLKKIPSGFDWVVNCVASSGGGAEEYRRTYLAGMRNVLDLLKSHPPQNFVYTSSTSVYGQNDGSWVDENSPTEPEAETAKVLLATESVLREADKHGFQGVVIRVSGIYGPGRGYWLRQFVIGDARLDGDGSRFLNMIHRDDVVSAIVAALQFGAPGQIYNVTDDYPVSQRELFAWLAETLNKPMPAETRERSEDARKRGATNKRISNGRLRTELKCDLTFPTFKEGFQQILTAEENKD